MLDLAINAENSVMPHFSCHIVIGRKMIQDTREIHPLEPQPNRHSMLVPRVCAPRVRRWSLGRYWSRDLCSKQAAERLTGWLGIQTVISYLGQIGCRGSQIWWRMHSAHSLSTALRGHLWYVEKTQSISFMIFFHNLMDHVLRICQCKLIEKNLNNKLFLSIYRIKDKKWQP